MVTAGCGEWTAAAARPTNVQYIYCVCMVILYIWQVSAAVPTFRRASIPPICDPFDTVYSPLSHSGNPGVDGVSHRGANWARLGGPGGSCPR